MVTQVLDAQHPGTKSEVPMQYRKRPIYLLDQHPVDVRIYFISGKRRLEGVLVAAYPGVEEVCLDGVSQGRRKTLLILCQGFIKDIVGLDAVLALLGRATPDVPDDVHLQL